MAAVLVALAGSLTYGLLSRRTDVEDRRASYGAFPLFPGAIERESERYEITSDGGGTGDYGLRVTYELPGEVTAAEVLGFYRSNIPDGWTSASDETCRRLREQIHEPPTATALGMAIEQTAGAPDYGLMQVDSQLTVFAPDATPPDGDGITFSLQRRGEAKYLVADEPTFACGSDEVDTAGDDFDR
ncbi:MAG TPA: hypothetical protein VNO51_04035 [Ilumatobacteraceae bacterium]|nr:hypothetical protein [Ilumatobacteraceae bacterium]